MCASSPFEGLIIATPASPDNDLVTTLRRTAQTLIDHRSIRDRETLLGQLVAAAVDLVPAASAGGLSRTDHREINTSHATTQAVYDLDTLQTRLGEGPCFDAAADPPPDGHFRADDLAEQDAQRWPRFAPYAVQAGYRSMLSTSVISERRGVRVALNLYAETPHAFEGHDAVTTGLFANQTGALLYGADHAEQMSAAIESRDLIGQAKGVLMERFTLDDNEAFEMLVKSSQDTNLKLVKVAQWVVEEVKARRQASSS